MILDATLQRIPVQRIVLAPHPFSRTNRNDLESLRQSLQEVGLLNPPWLKPLPEGYFAPVSGWRRLQAASDLGWETLPAWVLPPDTPELESLLLYLHDNAFSRPFHPLEQALLSVRLLDFWPRPRIVRQVLPLLRLPPSPTILERLVAAASLEPPWQELLAQERLSLLAAAHLAPWDPQARAAAWPFLHRLPWSHSKQMEFLEGVEILAHREGVTIPEILARPELGRILEDEALPPAQRAERIRHLLQEWLSPRYSAARRLFETGLTRLGLKSHPRLSLKPPPAFEGRDFELTVKFTDSRELKQHLETLWQMVHQEEFEILVDRL